MLVIIIPRHLKKIWFIRLQVTLVWLVLVVHVQSPNKKEEERIRKF